MATSRFPLRFPNEQSATIMRIAQLNLAVLGAGPLALALVGVVDWEFVSVWIPTFVLMTAVFYMNYGWRLRGEVVIDDDGIAVKGRTGDQFYPWKHIVGVRLTSARERDPWSRRLNAFCGIDLDEPIAEIRLRRSARIALFAFGWKEQMGTDVMGIPTLIGKRIPLPVQAPMPFVATAAEHIARHQRGPASPSKSAAY